MPDKGGFPHYMLKEIFDQPQGLQPRSRPGCRSKKQWYGSTMSVSTPTNCAPCAVSTSWLLGTSRHAGMAGQYMIQDLVNIPGTWTTPANSSIAIP